MWRGLEQYALRTGDFIIVNTTDGQQILAADGKGLLRAIEELKFNYNDIIPERSKIPTKYVQYLKKAESNYNQETDDWDSLSSYDEQDIYDDEEYDDLKFHCQDLMDIILNIFTNGKYADKNGIIISSLLILSKHKQVIPLDLLVQLFRFPQNNINAIIQSQTSAIQSMRRNISIAYKNLDDRWSDIPPVSMGRSLNLTLKDIQYALMMWLLPKLKLQSVIGAFVDTEEYDVNKNVKLIEQLFFTGDKNEIINPTKMASIIEPMIKNKDSFFTNTIVLYLKMNRNVYQSLSNEAKQEIEEYL